MTQREKMLLIGVVGVVGLWGLWRGLQGYQSTLADRRSDLTEVESKLRSVKIEQLATKQALANLENWQERSLPADLEVAQTDYRGWLVEQLGEAGLKFDNVRRVAARPVSDAYTSITYTAHAEGSLKQITQFLHAFYQLTQLHKMTVMKMLPLQKSGQLGLDVTIEALIITGTTREQGVAEGESSRLALAGLDEYLASIQSRNLFVEYVPPPPPRPAPRPRVVVERPPPPAPPKFDDSKHAFLTAVVGNGQGAQAWINVRTTGKTHYLAPDEEFEIGLFKGRVKAIDLAERRVFVEREGELLRLELGKHLREAVPAG